MCGIVGVTTGMLSSREAEIFEDLMVVSNLRGATGAGVAGIAESGTHYHCKTIHDGIAIQRSKAYNQMTSFVGVNKCNTLIGHTRAPTRGGTEITAVHPHTSEDNRIIGVHNGTMNSVAGQTLTWKDSDSKALIQSIATQGIRKTIETSSGAYAIVWYDSDERTLNFIRNSQRPLWFAKVAGGYTMYWASERAFLELVLRRKSFASQSITYIELPENTHVTFDLTKRGEIAPVREETIRPISTFQYRGAGAYGSLDDDWNGWDGSMYPSNRGTTTTTAAPTRPNTGTSVVPFKPDAKQVDRSSERPTVEELKNRPIKWVTLGKALHAGSDHGMALQCRQCGTRWNDELKKTMSYWQVTWTDGAISEYDHYPYYIWQYYIDKQKEIRERADAAFDMQKPEDKEVVTATTETPFRDSTDSSDSATSEAGNDCSIEEHRKRQAELDSVFGTEDPIEDDLPELFKHAVSRANNRNIPRLSKKEKRRARALERAQARAAARQQAKEETVVPFVPADSGFLETVRNMFVSEDAVVRALALGCDICGKQCDYSDAEWYGRTDFICDDCAQDDEKRQAVGLPEQAKSMLN